jgi:lysophospholipase L1-like esterase
VVDLLEIWTSTGLDARSLFLDDNVHLSARGYGEMARAVAESRAPLVGSAQAIR